MKTDTFNNNNNKNITTTETYYKYIHSPETKNFTHSQNDTSNSSIRGVGILSPVDNTSVIFVYLKCTHRRTM